MSAQSEVKAERDGSPLLKVEDIDGPKAERLTPPLPRKGPQLIGDLPRAEEEAMKGFIEMDTNWYQYKYLGRSRQQEEVMACECQYRHGVDEPWVACGEASDCINRITQVECLPDECRCRSHCQNQRFQRREHAKIEIVQTEKKGFGLRATTDLAKDTFIYEYIGEVVNQPSFMKRMREYAAEGIEHFYFMMLQKDEFIDATKKGGIGRFANHSCDPNCYVAKWVVGDKMRMGIFAKRKILKDEELTFNYNVDRYGHEAQACYCGEPKCVGFIGGKTQTDISGMDDLLIDALGIGDEVEQYGLKGSKKKRGKKLDEDFVPQMKPMMEKEVPKVINALRQTTSRKILVKLLTRVKITEDIAVLRQVTRLRAMGLMRGLLDEWKEDMEIVKLIFEGMIAFPLSTRVKVEDSKIEEPVKEYTTSENEAVKVLAEKLLQQWSTLEVVYRIPKRIVKAEDDDDERTSATPKQDDPFEDSSRPRKRVRVEEEPEESPVIDIKPMGFARSYPPVGSSKPSSTPPVTSTTPSTPLISQQPSRSQLAAIIANANARLLAEQAAAATPTPQPLPSTSTNKKPREKRKERSKAKPPLTEEEKAAKEAKREKQLQKLIGNVVVKSMSKYSKEMEHDVFKKHAKDLTQIIAEKEKRSPSYPTAKLDALSEEKQAKIKKFVKTYIGKVLKKIRERAKKKKREQSKSSDPSGSLIGKDDAEDEVHGLDEEDAANLNDMTVGDVAGEHEPDEDEEDEEENVSPESSTKAMTLTNGANGHDVEMTSPSDFTPLRVASGNQGVPMEIDEAGTSHGILTYLPPRAKIA